MLYCDNCKEPLELDEPYLAFLVKDFCSIKCATEYFSKNLEQKTIAHSCSNCEYLKEKREESMFGEGCLDYCTFEEEKWVDPFSMIGCPNFKYGKKTVETYSYYTRKTTIERY